MYSVFTFLHCRTAEAIVSN